MRRDNMRLDRQSIQLLNLVIYGLSSLLFLDAAYLALIKLSILVFNSKNIERLTILLLWAAMGLQETAMAPGWYNHYTVITFSRYGVRRPLTPFSCLTLYPV